MEDFEKCGEAWKEDVTGWEWIAGNERKEKRENLSK